MITTAPLAIAALVDVAPTGQIMPLYGGFPRSNPRGGVDGSRSSAPAPFLELAGVDERSAMGASESPARAERAPGPFVPGARARRPAALPVRSPRWLTERSEGQRDRRGGAVRSRSLYYNLHLRGSNPRSPVFPAQWRLAGDSP